MSRHAAATTKTNAVTRKVYYESPFIHAVDHLPATKHAANTNHVQMTVRSSGDRLVLVCVIDNLIKGASGAAVQNMNVMFKLDQRLGLLQNPFPLSQMNPIARYSAPFLIRLNDCLSDLQNRTWKRRRQAAWLATR